MDDNEEHEDIVDEELEELDDNKLELLFSNDCVDILILFWASREWTSCSNSFTKSIAPPTIDAWSP